MGSKKPKMEVVQYYMSIHYGICSGPVDEIRALIVDKKEAWKGSLSAQTDIAINQANLFGGIKKEGGAVGTATFLPGLASQLMPSNLAAKLGLTTDTCPAYRGISSIFFHGGSGNRGFYWRANSPYLPGAWVVARRRPKVLDAGLAMIGDDANPAYIIYEALTNTDWGMGASSSMINVASFNTAAQTLFNEGFGMSILWTQQETIENFVTNIINHIEAALFVNPRDGLLTLKLIRADYDASTLPIFTPDNATLSNFQRKLWADTVNEIVVSWTNPESEESETVSVQDLANVAMQGGIVSDSKNYPGIRKADLAMHAATRDLRVASSPLASCEMICDRSAWDVVPGAVIKVTWPEHGMQEVVMRVGPVDYGTTRDSAIKLALVEDVFSLPQASYVQPPTTGWVDPSEKPTPIVWSQVFTLPYLMVRNTGDDFSGNQHPEVVVGVLAAQPGADTPEVALASQTTNLAGVTDWEVGSTVSITSRGTISAPLIFESTSIVVVDAMTQGRGAQVGSIAVLGANDGSMEMCVVTSVAGNIIGLNRGVLDTTPKAWPADTPIWFLNDGMSVHDRETHMGGQSITYRLLSTTSRGMLEVVDASSVTGLLTARPWLPTRPANVKINGVMNGLVDAVGATSVAVTWANRNRLMEENVALQWTAATVPPEDGQTTTITVMDIDRNVITSHDGLTGASFSLPAASFGGNSIGIVRVSSKRDGLESLQAHEISVKVAVGYGLGYGYNYGAA